MSPQSGPSLCPDTKTGSFLHWLVGYRVRGSGQTSLVVAYVVLAAAAYLPVLFAAVISGVPLWRANHAARLTLLHDWGLAYGLLISLPTLFVLFLSDELVLAASLRQIQRDGIVDVADGDAKTLTESWERKFRKANIVSQLAGITAGLCLGLATLLAYRGTAGKTWIVPVSGVGLVSYSYAFGISLLYAMVIIYVWRCVTISSFLRALVAVAPLRLLPFHPDKCGGLRPVGRLGLRNQYTLTILGLNIVLLILVWVFSQDRDQSVQLVLLLASLAYLTLGPLVFMAPLLPFRDGMLQAKAEWTSQVAGLLRKEFERLRGRITTGEITSTDEAAIDRLRKLGAVIDELPVWPFDAQTLRKFATAYVVPLLLPVLGKVLLLAIGL